MRKTFWRTKKFRSEQQRWYRKLRVAGFVDIEPDDDREFHRPISRQLFDNRNAILRDRDAVQFYFEQARAFVHTGEFETLVDKQVWEAHAEGMSIREAARALGLDRNVVYKTICRYRALAGLSRRGTHERGDHETDKHRKAQ